MQGKGNAHRSRPPSPSPFPFPSPSTPRLSSPLDRPREKNGELDITTLNSRTFPGGLLLELLHDGLVLLHLGLERDVVVVVLLRRVPGPCTSPPFQLNLSRFVVTAFS